MLKRGTGQSERKDKLGFESFGLCKDKKLGMGEVCCHEEIAVSKGGSSRNCTTLGKLKWLEASYRAGETTAGTKPTSKKSLRIRFSVGPSQQKKKQRNRKTSREDQADRWGLEALEQEKGK